VAWTAEPPKVSGPYWVRFGPRRKAFLCRVNLCGREHAWGADCNGCTISYFGTDQDDYIDARPFAGTEWAGPLVAPSSSDVSPNEAPQP
jgi:hypothetical protein